MKSKRFLFIWSEKRCLSLKLFTTDPKEKSYLPNWFTMFQMLIEEILSPIAFVTKWTSTGLKNVWLLLLVNISSKISTIPTTTLGFSHSSFRHFSHVTKSCIFKNLILKRKADRSFCWKTVSGTYNFTQIPLADWPGVVVIWAPSQRQKAEAHIFERANFSGFVTW